jgi:hypothetical protein
MRLRAEEEPLSWEEFCETEPPLGLNRAQAWELLFALRRQTRVELPLKDGEGKSGWHLTTRSMIHDFADIDRRSYAGSRLDMMIHSQNVTYILLESIIEEAQFALQEDGVFFEYEQARSLLMDHRVPSTPEEHLLVNCFNVLWELELINQPFTPELIEKLYDLISKGAPSTSRPMEQFDTGKWSPITIDSHEQSLLLICQMANGLDSIYADHPVLIAETILYIFTNARPLPRWNGVVGSLAAKLYFMHIGLPVLAYTPLLKMDRLWRNGIINPPLVPTTWLDSMVVMGNEVDFTLQAATLAALAKRELDKIEAKLLGASDMADELSEILQHSPTINVRQHGLLLSALRNPSAVFKIDSHKRACRVSYPTARADILNLVDMGYFECQKGARAFIFVPKSNMLELLKTNLRK